MSLRIIQLVLLMISTTISVYAEKEIAITIDDLPFVGAQFNTPGNIARGEDRFHRILNSLKDNNIPATGFVIAGSIGKGQWQLLEDFKSAGFILGNHTYSHKSLSQLGAKRYIEDVDKADQILTPLMQAGSKYFRYPYLAEGQGETKKSVLDYLKEKGYVIAPVTIDPKDFAFNSKLLAINWRVREQNINKIKEPYLNYMWRQTERAEKLQGNKPQILLIHANLLNSFVLPEIIELYRKNGYKFISLDEALRKRSNQQVVTLP